ncbi:MAG: type I restriction enzyme HsdR N-terminal domain-containing protein [Chlamydiia bacterium]|nr:type I restriction enzyme HsdR N-terminal domain-containing protein [Chlamydiia bacterium]
MKSYLYDPVRQQRVAARPEELVRQNLLERMIGSLGFPRGLIAVERSVGSHLGSDRRFDLLCYAVQGSMLRPLLMIECKAAMWDEKAQSQVFGYNESVAAPFVALACESAVKTFWREGKRIASAPFLPSYAQLVEKLCLL